MNDNTGQKNIIQIIKNDTNFIKINCQLVMEARKFIFFHTYIFEDDSVTAPLIESLCTASSRGVKIFFLIDAIGSPSLKDETVKKLSHSGVHFTYFTPLFNFTYLGRRLHQKMLIIDNKKLLLGGINYGKSFNDPEGQAPWLDYACLAEGEIVQKTFKNIHSIYLSHFTRNKKEILACLDIKNTVEKQTIIKINVNDWMKYKQDIYHSYMTAIKNAQDEIIILATYFLPSKKLLKSLKKASQRGVQIHLIFSSRSDHLVVDLASEYYYRWYLDNNINIYEWSESIIHGKVAVIDELWSTIGSYNHNYTSQYGNLEANLEIFDKAFSLEVKKELKGILEKSHIIDDAKIKEGYLGRILVSLVYFLTNFIMLISLFFIYTRNKKENK